MNSLQNHKQLLNTKSVITAIFDACRMVPKHAYFIDKLNQQKELPPTHKVMRDKSLNKTVCQTIVAENLMTSI